MTNRDLQRISKGLARILRHESARLGLSVDPEGFVPISEVLSALQHLGIGATDALVRAVVAQVDPHKGRYTILDDAIRANYGHSVEQPIAYPAVTPPDLLLHGTTDAARARILEQGLLPMGRQFVHLTDDADLARQVGGRRGKPCVLQVDARRAHADGIVFLLANERFWLTRHVPSAYLSA